MILRFHWRNIHGNLTYPKSKDQRLIRLVHEYNFYYKSSRMDIQIPAEVKWNERVISENKLLNMKIEDYLYFNSV